MKNSTKNCLKNIGVILLVLVTFTLIIMSRKRNEYLNLGIGGKKRVENINKVMNDSITKALTFVSLDCNSTLQQDQNIEVNCKSQAGKFAVEMYKVCVAAGRPSDECIEMGTSCGIYDVSQDQKSSINLTCVQDSNFTTKLQNATAAELEKIVTKKSDGTAKLLSDIGDMFNPKVSIGGSSYTKNKNETINKLTSIVDSEFSTSLKSNIDQIQELKVDAESKTVIQGLHQKQVSTIVAKALQKSKGMREIENIAKNKLTDSYEDILYTNPLAFGTSSCCCCICMFFVFLFAMIKTEGKDVKNI